VYVLFPQIPLSDVLKFLYFAKATKWMRSISSYTKRTKTSLWSHNVQMPFWSGESLKKKCDTDRIKLSSNITEVWELYGL
jgi:hypothetical protein